MLAIDHLKRCDAVGIGLTGLSGLITRCRDEMSAAQVWSLSPPPPFAPMRRTLTRG